LRYPLNEIRESGGTIRCGDMEMSLVGCDLVPHKSSRGKRNRREKVAYILAMYDEQTFLVHGIEWIPAGEHDDHQYADDPQRCDDALLSPLPDALHKWKGEG
jgi:hypothetical protein